MNGEERAFVVTGEMEKVFPMDIFPMQLLKECMAENIDKMESLGIYEVAPEDFSLIDYSSSSKIALLDYLGMGYKIKITLDGIAKYYLFDTGAADLIINRDLERELLLNGSLKKEDYMGTTSYSMADNTEVKAQLIKLSNVKVGDYVVQNVVAAIIDDGSLLCGMGLLDKFRKWELDDENKTLVLFK